jgi:3-mercaptopyruvate sulfurtransferase SseA
MNIVGHDKNNYDEKNNFWDIYAYWTFRSHSI